MYGFFHLIVSRFLYGIICISTLFLFVSSIPLRIYPILFIQALGGEHLTWVNVWPIINYGINTYILFLGGCGLILLVFCNTSWL